MRDTLSYTARFLRTNGWWPRFTELCDYMRAPKYAVHWFVTENIAAGVLEWKYRWPNREVRITEAGWRELGFVPIEPKRRPKASLHDRITKKVVAEMEKQMRAAREQG